MLTSDEAKSHGVEGWDTVLAKIKGFKAEVTERKIANFWPNWWHNRLMALKLKNSKGPKPNTSKDPTVEAAGSTTIQGNNTPNVDANKRKCTDMPNSAEPQTKHTYARLCGLWLGLALLVLFQNLKKQPTLCGFTPIDVEKGAISKDYFFEVVSRCNIIKVDGLLDGKTEFSWCSDMRGQPTYDSDHSRGKIVCFDLQTFNFWRTYIPIATLQVGDTSCKAWSWEEYDVSKIQYSCLIPIDTCKGLEVRKLIKATLVMNNLSMEDVLTCRTAYAKVTNQRICNIEVTDQLANLLDYAGRVLRGPVCSLSFKLQTGSTKDPDDEPYTFESNPQTNPILGDVEMLESVSADGSLPSGDTNSQVLDSSTDTITQPKSPTTSVSSSTQSILSQVKSLVVTPPVDSTSWIYSTLQAGFLP